MKERSKRAARTRREQENQEFEKLARLLPLPTNITTQLDRASVVKLTTASLKLRGLFPYGLGVPWGSGASDDLSGELASFLQNSLEGFLFILAPNLKIIYVSEGISSYLGLSQVEMIGNSVNEYVHPYDQDEVKILMAHEEIFPVVNRVEEDIKIARNFTLRMKCVLSKRSAGLTTDGYKLIHFRGYLKMIPIRLGAEGTISTSDVRYKVAGLIAVGNAMHPTSIVEVKMHGWTFMYRADLDFKFLHLDPKILELTGYEPQHLHHKSLYTFIHINDAFKLREDHKTLLAKGQAVSSYYRFLTCNGGWIWMQSYFLILLSSKSRQTFILAINHGLSEREYDEYLLEEEQTPKRSRCKWDENGRLVSAKRSVSIQETVNKEMFDGEKKPLLTNYDFKEQFPAANGFQSSNTRHFIYNFPPVTNIQPSNISVPFVNNFPSATGNQLSKVNIALANNSSPLNYVQSFAYGNPQINCAQPVNETALTVNDLQSIVADPSVNMQEIFAQTISSQVLTLPFNDLKASWCNTNGHVINSFPSTDAYEMICHSNISPLVNNSNNYYGLYNPVATSLGSAFLRSENNFIQSVSSHSNPVTNNVPLHSAQSIEYPETAYAIAEDSRSSNSKETLPFYVERIDNNILESTGKFAETTCTSPFLSPVAESNVTQNSSSKTNSPVIFSDQEFESSKNIGNHTPSPSSEMNVDRAIYFQDINGLKYEASGALNVSSFSDIKCKRDIKVQQVNDLPDRNFSSDDVINTVRAKGTLTEMFNPSCVPFQEMSQNWVVSKDSLNGTLDVNTTDLRSEGTSSLTLVVSQAPHDQRSPQSANSDFSFSSDLHNDHKHLPLNNSSDYSSGFWDQSYRDHSEANCDDLSINISNSQFRNDAFNQSCSQFPTNSPLYTIL